MDNKKKILFVCILNAARSQAAEAFFKHFIKGTPHEGRWQAESAGMMSREGLNPNVVRILHDKGVPTDGQFSKKIDFTKLREYDKIISFVPFPKGGLHDDTKAKISLWVIADPLGRPYDDTKDIVNAIEQKVRELVDKSLV